MKDRQPAFQALHLEREELLYLTSLVGGSRLPGIEADFSQETEAALRQIMDIQQRKLEGKGLLAIGFDGTAQINPTLRDFVMRASTCEAYCCQITRTQEQELSRVYYFAQAQESAFYEMICEIEPERYTVRQLYDRHALQLQVLGRFPLEIETQDEEKLLTVAEVEDGLKQALQTGAVYASAVLFELRQGEWKVGHEFTAVAHEGRVWRLGQDGEEYDPASMTFAGAMNEICKWVRTVLV